jgi:hypothetical protein
MPVRGGHEDMTRRLVAFDENFDTVGGFTTLVV